MKRHGAHSESRQAPAGLLRGLEIIAVSCSCCNEGALRGASKEREHVRKGSTYLGESKKVSREVVVFELRLEG